MDYKEKYENGLECIQEILSGAGDSIKTSILRKRLQPFFRELKESEDEKTRKELLEHCINRRDGKQVCVDASDYGRWADWLFRHGVENIPNVKSEPKENEDEKIRKWLIAQLKIKIGDNATLNNMIYKAIAWLEKQGGQEQLYIRFGEIPTDEKSKIYQGEIEVGIENGVSVYPAFKTNEGDIVLGLSLPITKTTLHTQQHLIEYDNRPCYLVKGDCVGKDIDGQPLINNVSIIEKIDNYRVKEEKQGDSAIPQFYETKNGEVITYCESEGYKVVEPKFKVRDWATNSIETVQITGYDIDYGYQVDYKGNLQHRDTDIIEKEYHPWTIQDAKDGDVLHSIGFHNDCIFIFNGLDNWKFNEPNGDRAVATGYCCLSVSADKMEFGMQGPDCIEVSTIKPATQKQRDLLFFKMKEAGYKWDAEKKELKKIEQKTAWSEEDDMALVSVEWCCNKAASIAKDENDMGTVWYAKRWLKSLKERMANG